MPRMSFGPRVFNVREHRGVVASLQYPSSPASGPHDSFVQFSTCVQSYKGPSQTTPFIFNTPSPRHLCCITVSIWQAYNSIQDLPPNPYDMRTPASNGENAEAMSKYRPSGFHKFCVRTLTILDCGSFYDLLFPEVQMYVLNSVGGRFRTT